MSDATDNRFYREKEQPSSKERVTDYANPLYILRNHEQFHEAFSPILADAIEWAVKKIADEPKDALLEAAALLFDLVIDFDGLVPGDHLLRLAEKLGQPSTDEAWDIVRKRLLSEPPPALQIFAEWAAGARCDDEYAPRMVAHIAALAKDALAGKVGESCNTYGCGYIDHDGVRVFAHKSGCPIDRASATKSDLNEPAREGRDASQGTVADGPARLAPETSAPINDASGHSYRAPWYCVCKQLNSGWASVCGRCEKPRNSVSDGGSTNAKLHRAAWPR